MIKNYILIFTLLLALTLNSQEVLTFSGYNGGATTITATTSTVNDDITIVFEDTDIINNFYTEGRNFLYIFGGLRTDAEGPGGGSSFQGSPGFLDNGSQPIANLDISDTDVNTGPNTYSITINLTAQYTGVTDGTQVFGYDLIFRNEFSAGADNNQTSDLYIDLVNANKDSSVLNANNFDSEETVKTSVKNKILSINSSTDIDKVSIYNLLGQVVFTKNYNNENNISIGLETNPIGIYIVKIDSNSQTKTSKVSLN